MRQFLRKLLRWLLGLFGLLKRPDRLVLFKLEIDGMSDVRLSWELPTPTVSQRPIDHVRIEARVVGAPDWAEINQVTPPTTELVVQDIASGDWEFRGIVVDTDGDESSPVAGSVSVPFDPPSPLTSFEVQLL